MAEKIAGDAAGLEVCGIVQHAWQHLPQVQRLIANGDLDGIDCRGRSSSQLGLWIRKALKELVHWGVWWAHGCPRQVQANAKFTDLDLAARCRQSHRPFLRVDHLGGSHIAEFARRQRADLIVVLGQPLLSRELLAASKLGLVRIKARGGTDPDIATLQEGIEISVEYFAKGAGSACDLGSVSLPSQPYDGLLGITLKSDLIADDLLFVAAKNLEEGHPACASKELTDWIRRVLSPCLKQFSAHLVPSSALGKPFHQRYRSTAKLLVHSLLGLPWIMGRNWYRRWSGRYPVVILAHHLVSDRPHSMGIPTEDFWRRVRFLQRHYRIVGLAEARRLLRSARVSAPTAVLTFDDGYCDNYITLRAVAEETGAKIAQFIATGQIEQGREFDHDLAAGTRGFLPLTWDQVQEWSARDVEFGSHTRTHFDCGSSDRARLLTEIAGSRKDLEIRLGRRCRFFAFPFGKGENISPEAVRIAASSYSSFFSSYGGENLPRKGHIEQHMLRKGFYFDPWELELEMQSVFSLAQNSKEELKEGLSRLRPKILIARPVQRWLRTLVHGGLLLLAVLPPLRRLLNEISPDR
jgi:hypothetical protein